jgi:hypothetical protein
MFFNEPFFNDSRRSKLGQYDNKRGKKRDHINLVRSCGSRLKMKMKKKKRGIQENGH